MSTLELDPPSRHTVSAAEVAHDLTEKYPSLYVIGSLARAAHMGIAFDNLRPSGVARDLDIVRLTTERDVLPATIEGVDIDPLFEHWIKSEANGTYLVFPHNPKLHIEIPHAEEVFAPQTAVVNGEAIRVPHADTLAKISTMQYIQRPKDKRAMAVYNSFLDSLDSSERLPQLLLEPFNVFRDELSRRRTYIARSYLRNAYHRAVPERVRKQLDIGDRIGWLRSKPE